MTNRTLEILLLPDWVGSFHRCSPKMEMVRVKSEMRGEIKQMKRDVPTLKRPAKFEKEAGRTV